MKIVLATRNPGKVRELAERLQGLGIELVSMDEIDGAPEVEEDAETLEGNASKKARALHRHTGYPSLADDTGLEVDALGGRPGVRSARFAGEGASDAANRSRLLEQMAIEGNRTARFRTVLAFVDDDNEHLFEGVCTGRISEQPRGEGGFGYDPVFLPEEHDQTFAEMTLAEKNAISHRGRAVAAFVAFLREREER